MKTEILETALESELQSLTNSQKEDVLNFVNKIKQPRHSTRLYRKRAMRQIRTAILDQNI